MASLEDLIARGGLRSPDGLAEARQEREQEEVEEAEEVACEGQQKDGSRAQPAPDPEVPEALT